MVSNINCKHFNGVEWEKHLSPTWIEKSENEIKINENFGINKISDFLRNKIPKMKCFNL